MWTGECHAINSMCVISDDLYSDDQKGRAEKEIAENVEKGGGVYLLSDYKPSNVFEVRSGVVNS